MKKILLALMMISSFAFADNCPTSVVNGVTTFYKTSNQTIIFSHLSTGISINASPPTYVNTSVMKYEYVASVLTAYCHVEELDGGSVLSGGFLRYSYNGYDIYYSTTPPVPTCTSNQYLENNVCINQPTCELGTTLNPTTHTCIIDFPISSTETLSSGSKLIHFEDGKMMLLRSDGSAEMWDKNTGEFIFPNRAYNGVIPPSASFNPLSFNPSEPIQYKELTFGDFVAFEFNQAGLALKNVLLSGNGSALFPNRITGVDFSGELSFPLFNVASKQQTPEGDIITKSASSGGVSIDISKMDFSNIDFSEYETKATSTPQTIPNTNIQVQKITTPPNPNDSNNWAGAGSTIKGWAGVGELGSVIVSTPYNPNTALITTPTQVKIATIKPDNSVDVVTIQKSDLISTATNNNNLNFQTSNVTPSKINNDGTTSQTTTTTGQGYVSPTNGTTTNTSATTGATTTTINPTSGTPTIAPTTSPNGNGTIDLSGVTSRLDKISNQFNKLLTDVDAPASDIPPTAHNIPNVPTILTSWESSWNDARNSLISVNEKATQLQSLYQNGFTFNLTGGTVLTCPYSSNLDLGVLNREITFDFCKILSPFRPVTYTFFYLFFVFLVLSFSFKLVLRLV